MTSSVFDVYSQYYDLLYFDKDYQAETEYLTSLFERYGLNGRNLVEFGSGTGIHGSLLAERGYSVVGVERSIEMVASAQKMRGLKSIQGDICTIELGQKFDAVLSIFHVVSYLTTNDNLQAVFQNAAKHLDVGGLFVFDFWYSPAVYFQKPSVRIKRISNSSVHITRIAEPVVHENDNCVDVKYTVFARDIQNGKTHTFQETHPMRHFSIPEIELYARISGFELVVAEEFLTSNVPSKDTWGVCVVLRRVR